MTQGVEPGTWAASSTLNGTNSPQVSPEIVHNHYYAADQTAVPWYRRRKFHFWLAVLVLVIIVVASAVVLGVVLKLDLGKRRVQTSEVGGSSTSSTLEETSRPSSLFSSLSESHTSTSSNASSTTPPPTSTSSSSGTVSAETTPRLNETVMGILSSFLATFTEHNIGPSSSSSVPSISSSSAASSSSSSAASSSSSSAASSSSSSAASSSSSSTTASTSSSSSTSTSARSVETTAETFILSESSQLASAYFKSDTPELHRRVLVWQDDRSDLIATEWSAGRRLHYRIRDHAESRLPQAKHGTPLAMTVSSSGVIHVFFLDTQGALSHAFEETNGEWKRGMLGKNNGPIIASTSSPLSAMWHRGSVGRELLGVAYANSQKLRLAMTDRADEDSTWQVVEAVSLPDPVPGMTETPLFSVAGDWGKPSSKMLMAVLVEDGLFAWQCSLDHWPPSKARAPCNQLNDTFIDERGRNLGLGRPPRQLSWIKLGADEYYDFSLLSLEGEGRFVAENRIKAGTKGRRAGRGLDTRMATRAIAVTDEGILFAAADDDVYIYKANTEDWTWRTQGSVMPARGSG